LEQEDSVVRCNAKILNELNIALKILDQEIEENLPEKAQKLKELKGISDLVAATIYTETKGKLISKEALASYCGVAPVERSSGRSSRHQNNKSGNRILNSVFYRMSIMQSIYDEKGKAYFEKKISEGKSKRHARKCLSRQLVNIVFKLLQD